MFGDSIDLLYFLTLKPVGMTVGELQKAMPGKTRGQIERILKPLIAGNFVSVEKVFYRSNKDKNMYRIEARTINCMKAVVSSWNQSAKQLKMELEAKEGA